MESRFFIPSREAGGLLRASRNGMGEEPVFSWDASVFPVVRILPFPDGNRLLVVNADPVSFLEGFTAYEVDLSKRSAVDLGTIPAESSSVTWAEPGKSLLVSRTVSGLTNIWKYNLSDKSLTQVTLGTGPDTSPMLDPGNKGIYFVSGKLSGFLTLYNIHSKASTDIAQNATQPVISPDGKRVIYIVIAAQDRNELWASNIDGSNKVKIATGTALATGFWAADSSHFAFVEEVPGKGDTPYIAAADGTGVRPLQGTAASIQSVNWSADQKSVFLNIFDKARCQRIRLERKRRGCGPGEGRRGLWLRFRCSARRKLPAELHWQRREERNLRVLARRQEVHFPFARCGDFRPLLRPRRQIVHVRRPLAARRNHLSPGLAGRKIDRPTPGCRHASFRISAHRRRQRLRSSAQSRVRNLRPRRWPRRLVPHGPITIQKSTTEKIPLKYIPVRPTHRARALPLT